MGGERDSFSSFEFFSPYEIHVFFDYSSNFFSCSFLSSFGGGARAFFLFDLSQLKVSRIALVGSVAKGQREDHNALLSRQKRVSHQIDGGHSMATC